MPFWSFFCLSTGSPGIFFDWFPRYLLGLPGILYYGFSPGIYALNGFPRVLTGYAPVLYGFCPVQRGTFATKPFGLVSEMEFFPFEEATPLRALAPPSPSSTLVCVRWDFLW